MMNRNVQRKERVRSDAFVLNDKQIIELKKHIQCGHTLLTIAQSFGMSKEALVKIIKRDPKVTKAYGQARMEFLKSKLSWYENLFKPENIDKVDPHLLMKAFEFTMRTRAGWGTDPNLDSLGEDEKVASSLSPEEIIVEKVKARFLEDNAKEIKLKIEKELLKKDV